MPLSDLVPRYYALAHGDYAQTITPGQLCWAATFYLAPHPDVLVEVDPDPTETRLTFRLQRASAQSFTAASHRPLKSMAHRARQWPPRQRATTAGLRPSNDHHRLGGLRKVDGRWFP